MSSQRRFKEEEIAKIFEKATRAQNAANEEGGTDEGLSLEELKHIGESTGINPAFILQAIADLDKDASLFSIQKHMGFSYGITRSVKLPASFSERDWERLVVDFRKTFNHRGTIKKDGSFREWTHQFTHAYVEPTPDGYELKLEAKNGNIKPLLWAGIVYIFFAFFLFAILSSGAEPGLKTALTISGLALAAGLGMSSVPFFASPRWIRKKEQQFDEICQRALAATPSEVKEEPSPQRTSPNEKFLTLEDEEDLNHELKQFAKQKRANR